MSEKLFSLKLNVPFSQRHLAKKFGAKWDPDEKSWFAPSFEYIDRGLDYWWEAQRVVFHQPQGINRKKTPVYKKRYLGIELVPKTCWYSNVRSNVSLDNWGKLKKYFNSRSGYRCQICHGQGLKHPVELHEVWAYDDTKKIQTLKDFISLCPACHEVKHFGRTMVVGRDKIAKEWIQTVNCWGHKKPMPI